jgi:hypothetical protein
MWRKLISIKIYSYMNCIDNMRCKETLTHMQCVAKKTPIITKIFLLYFCKKYYKPELMLSHKS